MLRSILPTLLLLASASSLAEDLARAERSVVRIVNFSQRSDWSLPWDVGGVGESSGSGFVIEGGLVMTNAHVVSDSKLLLLLLHNDPEPYEAEVLHIAHDCDLALLRPLDPAVTADVPALRFGGLPALGSTVHTLGFPVGGLQVSATRGVVSRIEQQLYVHSEVDVHLAVQTDAAINAGNSGGPVIQDGRVVGVAFQANLNLESVGFFIPEDVIERFLLDVEDGRYDGYPELGTETVGLENDAARARLGLREDESGVRVRRILHGSSADGPLVEGDVILAVEGRTVANDGSVSDRGARVPFGMLVDRMQIGDTVTLKLLRDGARIELDVVLDGNPMADSRARVYDRGPRYFVYAGLVFVALDREVMGTYGVDWPARAPRELLHEYVIRPAFEPELLAQERVVLLRRLRHPVNAEMAWYRDQVVERVNGRPIAGIDDLIETIEGHEGAFHVIEFASGRRFSVLEHAAADAANAEILERYGIPQDRSR